MTLLLGALCFCLLGSGACLDIKTESFEDLLHAGNAGALQGVGAWTKIFQSFGRGERMDADQLSKLAKVPKEFGPTSQVQVDPNFGLQLGEEKIQELRHLKDKPEDLMKLVNESAGFTKHFDLFCNYIHMLNAEAFFVLGRLERTLS